MALSNDTEYLVLIQLTILAYCSFHFADNFVAKFDMNVLHSFPIAPLVAKTRGVKDPPSTSITLWLYSSFSCSLDFLISFLDLDFCMRQHSHE